MFNIIQTVHHDTGRKPSRTWYKSAEDFYLALDMCATFNAANAEKNQREDSIAITYHVEYCEPVEWED